MQRVDGGVWERFARPGGKGALWWGFLAGPFGWTVHLGLSYPVVAYVCRSGATWILHAATVLSLLIVASGTWTAWRNWRAIGAPRSTHGADLVGRTRFMAIAGLALCAAFTLLILAEAVPNYLIGPCR